MAYATVSDVATWLGVDESALNTGQVQAILDAVSAYITAYTGIDFDAQTDDAGNPIPVPDGIHWVTVTRTARIVNNPNGVRQETIGTYSYSLGSGTDAWTTEEQAVLNAWTTITSPRGLTSFSIGYTEGSA